MKSEACLNVHDGRHGLLLRPQQGGAEADSWGTVIHILPWPGNSPVRELDNFHKDIVGRHVSGAYVGDGHEVCVGLLRHPGEVGQQQLQHPLVRGGETLHQSANMVQYSTGVDYKTFCRK